MGSFFLQEKKVSIPHLCKYNCSDFEPKINKLIAKHNTFIAITIK